MQLELFTPKFEPSAKNPLWPEIWFWCCPKWEGLRVGGYASIHSPILDTVDGEPVYCYMETVRMVEELPSGDWIGEIHMGNVHGVPWPKDGVRVKMSIADIWPPIAVFNGSHEPTRRNKVQK